MKKRILAVALLFALVLSGCGKDKKTERDEGPIGHGTVTQNPTGKGTVPEGTPKYDFYISEVMADNRGLYLGGDSDWIEIGSREETVVSLNGYYLTDNPEKPHAFSLAGNVIEDGGFVVVLLSDDAPFHLSGLGETVYLFHDNEIVDSLTYPEDIGDRSASKDGILSFATPGYPNT